MKFKIKIWHLLFVIWILFLFFRFNELTDIYNLLFSWINLLNNNSDAAISQLNFDLADVFLSGLLYIIIPLLLFFLRSRINFLYDELTFASFVLTILLISFLFAPLITNRHPDFYGNIGMTKLLPPLSSVKILHFKVKKKNYNSSLSDFISLRDKVVKKPFDENIEFIDSIVINKKIIFYQNEIIKEAEKDDIIFKDEEPLITTHIFLLGSDQFGRDIFTRLIYGARISLFVGIASVLISLIIGLTLGFIAGYTGGIINTVLSRITDMFLSFPIIFLVILILALFGNSLFAVIVVLGFAGWMSLFKIVKTEVLSIKNKNYFISAKMLGLRKRELLFKEILPVIIVPVVVNLIFQFANVIIAESALSYLGLGPGSNYPSWGGMIQAGQEYLSSAWWMIVVPGLTLIFTLLSANSFGISLNKKLNPQLRND